MRRINKENGITLIALIITIIVLLILSGVSISMIIGNNGILNRASAAKVKTQQAQEKEEIQLAYTTAKTIKMAEGTYTEEVTVDEFNDALEANNIDAEVEEEGGKFKVTFSTGNVYRMVNGVIVDEEDSGLKDDVVAKYTVIYNTNGGSGAPTDSTQYVEGDIVEVSTTIPTRPGFEFKGWATTPGATTADVGNTITIGTSDVTIYAVWKDNRLVTAINGANGDYGKSINYSVTVNGTKLDNWKVYYRDENHVYIILDGNLNANLVPSATGLQTDPSNYPFGVWSDTAAATTVSLKSSSNWSIFATGIEGATATGSPTLEMLIRSWNENSHVNSTQISSDDATVIGNDTTGLYKVNTEGSVQAYWLAVDSGAERYRVLNNGIYGYIPYQYDIPYQSHACRPVIALPNSTTGTVGTTVTIDY